MNRILPPWREKSLIAVTGIRHGLGNRVRVVLGTRVLARLEGRTFLYTWTTGKYFGCHLDDLWDFDEQVIARSTAIALSTRFPFRDNSLDWLDAEARSQRILQIQTPHALKLPGGERSWESELRALQPVNDIADRVRRFHSSTFADEPYVGVMVRAHPNSHAMTLKESPIEWYLMRMGYIVKENPGVKFFVSADTPAALDQITGQIPNSFGLADKGGYNTRAGIRSSVADLYLLAGSSYVLAPYYSSFPDLARCLAGGDLPMETSHSRAAYSLPYTLDSYVIDPIRPHLRTG